MEAVYELTSRSDGTLRVFGGHVAITRHASTIVHGMAGTLTIPFTKITAVQFREAGVLLSGSIRFTCPDAYRTVFGIQQGDVFNFTDRKNNPTARAIKDYVEAAILQRNTPTAPNAPQSSLSQELSRLADLKQGGHLTDEEFKAAKRRLIG